MNTPSVSTAPSARPPGKVDATLINVRKRAHDLHILLEEMRDSIAQVRDGVGPMRNETWSTFLNKFDVINKGASALTDELDHSLTEGLDNFVAEPVAIAADAITLPELLRTKLDHDVARDFDALNKMFSSEQTTTADKTVSASAAPPPPLSSSASPPMSVMASAGACTSLPLSVNVSAQPGLAPNMLNVPTSVTMSTGIGHVAPGGSVAASPAMSSSATGAPAPSVPTSASGAGIGGSSGATSARAAAVTASAIDGRINTFNDMLDSVLKRFDDQRAILAAPRPSDVAPLASSGAAELVLAALSSGSGLRQ